MKAALQPHTAPHQAPAFRALADQRVLSVPVSASQLQRIQAAAKGVPVEQWANLAIEWELKRLEAQAGKAGE